MHETSKTIEERLLNMSTAFFAKVLSVKGNLASVQPLHMMKQKDGKTLTRSVVSDVPILHHVGHWKLVHQSMSIQDTYTGGGDITPEVHPTSSKHGHIQFEPIRAGDIVFCVCADRDISNTRKGKMSVPAIGHHEIKDAVIVGLFNVDEKQGEVITV